jgi:UDP-xylose:glucoside alpha-1,3-xylosyltransferase
MKKKAFKLTILVLFVAFLFVVYHLNSVDYDLAKVHQKFFKKTNNEAVIVIVGCGEKRVGQVNNAVKTALLFSKVEDQLKFIIFSQPEYHSSYIGNFSTFQTHRKFSFEIKNVSFPKEKGDEWKNLFKPCAAQRLFLPEILNEVDAVLYVDSDVLFLSSPTEAFRQFERFDETEIAALSIESFQNDSWYPRKAKHPFYGEFGLNSGVMLMNLTRMRNIGFQEKLIELYWKNHKDYVYYDQDLLNHYFKFQPHQMFELPCEFNYHESYSKGSRNCTAKDGVKIFHGNRGILHRKENPFCTLRKYLETVSSIIEPSKLVMMDKYFFQHDFESPLSNKILDEIRKNSTHRSLEIINKINLEVD